MDEQQALAGPYTLTWRGRALKFGGQTQAVKAACVAAAKLAAMAECDEYVALAFPGTDPEAAAARAEYLDGFRGDMVAGRWKWGGDLLRKWLRGPDGTAVFLRALLDEGGTPLSEGDFEDLARERTHDLSRVIVLTTWDLNNPKARKRPAMLEEMARLLDSPASTPGSSAAPSTAAPA